MIHIDGSYGEGGGQILRTSLSIAAITGKPITINNIRAKRKKPGLAAQHLTAVRAAAKICNADLQGDVLGSTMLQFAPQTAVQSGNYIFDVTEASLGGSAGSVALVLQTILLPLALANNDSQVILKGVLTLVIVLRSLISSKYIYPCCSVWVLMPKLNLTLGDGILKVVVKLNYG